MTDEIVNLILTRVCAFDEKVSGGLGSVQEQLDLVLKRIRTVERQVSGLGQMMIAMDGTLIAKQDRIDHLAHRVEAIERHLGLRYEVPSPT